MPANTVKENVHFRTTPQLKQRIANAAALTGQSITDFIESAAADRAQEILARETLVLTDEERDRFIAAIDNPPAPSPRMLEAAQKAMQAMREGVLIR